MCATCTTQLILCYLNVLRILGGAYKLWITYVVFFSPLLLYLVSQKSSTYFLPSEWESKFHTHKTKGTIIALYILIFRVLGRTEERNWIHKFNLLLISSLFNKVIIHIFFKGFQSAYFLDLDTKDMLNTLRLKF